jgi:chromosomal replication initiation ATPase DnaA
MVQELKFNIAPGQEVVISISIVDTSEIPTNKILHKPTLDELLLKVSDVSKVPISDIISVSKRFEFLIPRYAFCHIAHKVYGYSQASVGRLINRDHSTIVNACEQLENIRQQNIPDAVMLMNNLQKHFPSIL